MASVARPIHLGLSALGKSAAFVSGNTVADATDDSYVVGFDGRGFRNLPESLMRSVVHIHGIWTPFEYRAFKEARRRQASIVMSPHGALEAWAFDHKRIKKRIAWWSYQRRMMQAADLIVVNSPQESQRLRRLGLMSPIATIPNGVDLEGFSPEGLGTERERVVLFFSRIDPKKGLPDLLKAWCGLPDRKGYRLHIHGHGEASYVKRIRDDIAASGAPDIELLPPVYGPERWAIFAQASIYVLPSYSENFGIAIAEALTAGLPVITTRATPWSDLTGQGLGWIVDNDVAQLRQALDAAISLEPSALSIMRREANIYASQRFGWEAIVQRYVDTYEWLSAPSKAAPAWVDRG